MTTIAKIVLLLLLLLACILLTILSFIQHVFKAKGKKSRTVWLTIFILSLSMILSLVFYTAKKIKDNFWEYADKAVEYVLSDYEYTPEPNPQIELLKSYEPETVKGTVPEEFYTDFGFRDYWRFPLVYPYFIECVDSVEEGFIRESELKPLDKNIYHIIQFTMDSQYMLAQTMEGYFILNFSTHEVRYFNIREEMDHYAESIGFTGSEEWMTIDQYRSLF